MMVSAGCSGSTFVTLPGYEVRGVARSKPLHFLAQAPYQDPIVYAASPEQHYADGSVRRVLESDDGAFKHALVYFHEHMDVRPNEANFRTLCSIINQEIPEECTEIVLVEKLNVWRNPEDLSEQYGFALFIIGPDRSTVLTNFVIRRFRPDDPEAYLSCRLDVRRGIFETTRTCHILQNVRENMKVLPPALIMCWGAEYPLYAITYYNLRDSTYWRSAIYGAGGNGILRTLNAGESNEYTGDTIAKCVPIVPAGRDPGTLKGKVFRSGEEDAMKHVIEIYQSIFRRVLQLAPIPVEEFECSVPPVDLGKPIRGKSEIRKSGTEIGDRYHNRGGQRR
jgi:hypothetical protein